ncbi:MAG: hypothetical protein IJZ75_01890 [Clostridia bacterium]|nr:hypothetical protein [Clostridia bacterium]
MDKDKKIVISKTFAGPLNDVTATVAEAIEKLKESGGELKFQKGEYHFYKDNAAVKTLYVSNNDSGEKHIAFNLSGLENITVDGGGSTFIFHSGVFPFAAEDCENLTVKNFRMDLSYPLVALMQVGKKTEEGFFFKIDKGRYPYRIEDGSLIFESENGELSGKLRKFSLHRASRGGVQYLFTGNCMDSAENLPARYTRTDASYSEDGIYFKYRKDIPVGLVFDEGEELLVNIASGRRIDMLFFDKCSSVTVKNVIINRGEAMGIVATFCQDILIDGFGTDISVYNDYITLTGDALHFVNCKGLVEIKNCNITHTADDAINVHGVYTEFKKLNGREITADFKHQDHYGITPYYKGDMLDIINNKTLEIMGRARVENAAPINKGRSIKIICDNIEGKFEEGFFIENVTRSPDVYIHNNSFVDFPHIRLSGNGKILVEDNRMEKCAAALYAYDLAQYWYESGRIKDLTFRNNALIDCNFKMGKAFVNVGVSGFDGEDTPVIHERVEISGNTFEKITHNDITAFGVKDLIIKDNVIK